MMALEMVGPEPDWLAAQMKPRLSTPTSAMIIMMILVFLSNPAGSGGAAI